MDLKKPLIPRGHSLASNLKDINSSSKVIIIKSS